MSRLVVSIGHAEFTVANQTLYVIKVQQDADEWEVRRTYSDFRRLRDDVQKVMKDDKHQIVDDECSREFSRALSEVFFPAKRLFGSKKDRVVKERAVDLHHFLLKLLYLTHTYRKAQKALYDQKPTERSQGSASVFYLLRDFLKPLTVKTRANTSGDMGLDAHDDDDSMRKVIRESRMLSMRTSQQVKALQAQTSMGQIPEEPQPNGTTVTRQPSAQQIQTSSSSSKTLHISSLGSSSYTDEGPKQSPPQSKEPSIFVADQAKLSVAQLTSALPDECPSSSRVEDSSKPSKPHRKKKKRSSKTSKKSSRSREEQNSERVSRLNPQLTAQTITINAQKELEGYLTEYNAIMILRYVDKFISKAVTKMPGCYSVTLDNRLEIDCERFLEELSETFPDLPLNFEEYFQNPIGFWSFPSGLDAYVQMKWSSFQGPKNKIASENGKVSDSDEDSDSEYEYQHVGGGYARSKRDFTQEEEDVLQEMIANGTAGRDQVLRLKRQVNEQGWKRREEPRISSKGSRNYDNWSDTDDDELRQTHSSASSSSGRLSDHFDSRAQNHPIGGLV